MLSFFLNWSIITLQCCVSFCYTMKWVSYMYTYIPSFGAFPPPHHPSFLGGHRAWSWSPCATEQLPTSYLYYMLVCIYINPSVPIHHILSPLCPHVCSLHLCFYSCPVPFLLIPHISVNIWYMLFFFWLTSLCMMHSSILT